jgi:hypothetical protein
MVENPPSNSIDAKVVLIVWLLNDNLLADAVLTSAASMTVAPTSAAVLTLRVSMIVTSN